MQLTLQITVDKWHLDRIRNLYWHVRQLRPQQGARRRRLYREIAKHRRVLLDAGIDAEYLRLYCRAFASLDRGAVDRFERYAASGGDSFTKLYKHIQPV